MEDDLKEFEKLAASFADKELAGKAGENDRYPLGDFFGGALEKAYRAGLLNVTFPPELGGAGGGIGALCVILKTLCRADASLGGIIFTNALAREIFREANADGMAHDHFSRSSSARESLIAFPSYSDPSQTDVLPEAVRENGAYILTGRLELLVLGNLASAAIVPARLKGKNGWSFFVVDLSGPGIDRSAPVMTLGLHACPAVDISMKGGSGRLIGTEGEGERCFRRIAGKLSAAAAAMNTGIMEGSLKEALVYARTRFQGGRPIADWSQVGMILADMSMKTGAAALCLEQARLKLESGEPDGDRLSIAAALHIHELACDVVTNGIQVLGGYGYMKDYGQEKRYRDARQVQMLLGAPPFRKLSLIQEETVNEKSRE